MPGYLAPDGYATGVPRRKTPTLADLAAPTASAAPSATNYDQLFQDSLAQARSGVEAQLRNALGEIGRQEASQQQAVGMLPGQYNGLYDMATQQAQDFSSGADASVKAAGIQGAMPTASGVAPVLSAMAMGRATQLGGVPLLGLAVQDTAARQRGALEQSRLAAMSDLDAEQRKYLQNVADEQRQRQFSLADQQAQRQFSLEDRAAQYAHDDASQSRQFQNQLTLSQLDKNTKAQTQFGKEEISQERGAAIVNQSRYRADSAYTKLIADLQKSPPADSAELYQRIYDFKRKNPKANTLAMSLALFDLYGPTSAKG